MLHSNDGDDENPYANAFNEDKEDENPFTTAFQAPISGLRSMIQDKIVGTYSNAKEAIGEAYQQ